MPVETLAAAPQYQAAKPNGIEIPGVGQGEHVISNLPDLGGAHIPFSPKVELMSRSKEPLVLGIRREGVYLVKHASVKTTVMNVVARGSEKFHRPTRRGRRRLRCRHNRPKGDASHKCDEGMFGAVKKAPS